MNAAAPRRLEPDRAESTGRDLLERAHQDRRSASTLNGRINVDPLHLVMVERAEADDLVIRLDDRRGPAFEVVSQAVWDIARAHVRPRRVVGPSIAPIASLMMSQHLAASDGSYGPTCTVTPLNLRFNGTSRKTGGEPPNACDAITYGGRLRRCRTALGTG